MQTEIILRDIAGAAHDLSDLGMAAGQHSTRAPMPLRFDFTPRHFTFNQWFPLLQSFLSRDGGSFILHTTASISPSLSKSPKAVPRLQCNAVTPGPASEETSANRPPPRFL